MSNIEPVGDFCWLDRNDGVRGQAQICLVKDNSVLDILRLKIPQYGGIRF